MIVSGSGAGRVRLTFTSSQVGNGNPNDSNTIANQDGGLAVRFQAEDASGALVGPVSRFDDEGITFDSATTGLTFDVRDLVSGAARGDQFEVVTLGTAQGDVIDEGGEDRSYYINAGGGNDTVTGSEVNDFLVGGAGNDKLNGGPGNDTFLGGGGNDTLQGDDGADSLDGGLGADQIDGGLGGDTIVGGAGDDVLSGGGGKDVFWSAPGFGDDRVLDFNKGLDSLDISAMTAAGFEAHLTRSGKDTVVSFDDGSSITLVGVIAPKLEQLLERPEHGRDRHDDEHGNQSMQSNGHSDSGWMLT